MAFSVRRVFWVAPFVQGASYLDTKESDVAVTNEIASVRGVASKNALRLDEQAIFGSALLRILDRHRADIGAVAADSSKATSNQ